MANNRMWLVHKRTGKKILLAKYNTRAWWTYHTTGAVDEFFEEVQLAASRTFDRLWGPVDFHLEFEQDVSNPSAEDQAFLDKAAKNVQ